MTPQLRVEPLSKQHVFEGNLISAITIDEDQSILYIADIGDQRIITINYSPEKSSTTLNNIGVLKYIYEKVSTLNTISSLAVNLYG